MIYFLRHGLDDENFIGGHSSIDLINEGRRQIIASSKFIKLNLNINIIYSSDIKRSISSAEIVKETLANENIPLIVTPLLRELDKGDFTGREKSHLTEEENKKIEVLNRDIYLRYPNGESMIDLYERVQKLLKEKYFDSKDGALIVTHRGFINMLYFLLNNEDLSMEKTRFGVEHGSIHEMDLEKKKIKRIY